MEKKARAWYFMLATYFRLKSIWRTNHSLHELIMFVLGDLIIRLEKAMVAAMAGPKHTHSSSLVHRFGLDSSPQSYSEARPPPKKDAPNDLLFGGGRKTAGIGDSDLYA